MPIYEYRCDCGNAQEVFCPVKDRPETVLCVCGKKAKRVFSVPNFHGFEYADFRKEYLAHRDKYPEAEHEIRYCEEFTQTDRKDVWTVPRKRRKWIGAGYGGTTA